MTTPETTAPVEGGGAPEDAEVSLDDAIVAALDEVETREDEPSDADDEGSRDQNEPDPGDEGLSDTTIENAFKNATRGDQLQAPDHWSDDDKAKFDKLPDDATRQTILDWRGQIEKGAQEKFEAAATAVKEYEALSPRFQPYLEEMEAHGEDRIAVLNRIFDAAELLHTDPANGMAWVAQAYGADLAGSRQALDLVQHLASVLKVPFTPGTGSEGGHQTTEIDDLRARVARFEQAESARVQAQHRSVQNEAATTLKSFTEAKAEDGSPAHPHFETVKSEMGALIQAAMRRGESLTLGQAYESAVYARPDLREGLIQAKQLETAKAAAAKRKQSVARARIAHTPRSRSAPVNDGRANQDLDAIITSAFDEVFDAA